MNGPEYMTVVGPDGKETTREVSHREHDEDGLGWRQVPVLRDGERVLWVFGSRRPHIAEGPR